MRYLFQHVLLCDVVYNMQLRTRLRELHRRAAAAIESLHADDLALHYADLAYHYGQAQEPERAAHYALLAGRAASEISDYRQALALFTQALEWTPSGEAGRRARLLIEMGDAHGKLDEHARAAERLQDGLAAARAVGDTEAAADALGGLSRVALYSESLETARALGEEALALARQIGEKRAIVQATHRLIAVAFFQGDYEAVSRWGEEVLALTRALEDRALMAQSLHFLGNGAYRRQDYAAAIRYYRDSLALWQEVGGRFGISDCLSGLGNVALEQGDLTESARCHRESLVIAREIGNRVGAAIELINVGDALAGLGSRQEAAARYHEALQEAWAVGTVWVVMAALVGLAQLWAQDGQSLAAAELVGLACGHPLSNREVVQTASHVLALLRDNLGVEELERAMERGRGLNLDEVLTGLLLPAAGPAPARRSGW